MFCCERVYCDIEYIDRANQVIMDLFFFFFDSLRAQKQITDFISWVSISGFNQPHRENGNTCVCFLLEVVEPFNNFL